jgi:hypothetical protein
VGDKHVGVLEIRDQHQVEVGNHVGNQIQRGNSGEAC